MSTSSTPDNLVAATTGDPEDLGAVSTALRDSVQAALLKRMRYDFVWSDSTTKPAAGSGQVAGSRGFQISTATNFEWDGTANTWLALATVTDTGWITATLNSGVTAGVPVQYRRFGKTGGAQVYMTGRATGATTLLTLPTGFRPLVDLRFSVIDGGSGAATGLALVGADGTIRLSSATVNANLNLTWVADQ